MKHFWMVTRAPLRGKALRKYCYTKVRHNTLESAHIEAIRLAKLIGEPFVVLGIVAVIDAPQEEKNDNQS